MTVEHFDDVRVLLEQLDLVDIIVHEERARRVVWEDDHVPENIEPAMTLGFSSVGNALKYRFRMVLANDAAEYVADYEAVYVREGVDEISVSEKLIQEFAGKVAFMAVYPFIRASVFGSASRLGTSKPVLGLVRLGEFESGERLDDDAAQNAFFDTRSELSSQ